MASNLVAEERKDIVRSEGGSTVVVTGPTGKNIMRLDFNCVVCGKKKNFTEVVMLDDDKCVCKKCGESVAIGLGYSKEKGKNTRSSEQPTCDVKEQESLFPTRIKKELDRYVVGQESAKKILSVAAYNHFKRSMMPGTYIQKSNVLLVGPTGCGKTHLMKTFAKILNAPLAIVSATNLTETGWVGEDPSSVVGALLTACNGNVEKAERGIIYIDEIDKLAVGSSASKREVGGKGVQQALLPIIEGSVVSVQTGGSQGNPIKVDVDTTNILFVCGGAFPDMEEIIRKRMAGRTSIGFGSALTKGESETPVTNLLMNTTNDDLKEFGFIPEFIGRLPVLATLEELTVDTLRQILFEPEDSIVSQFRALFKFDGVELEIDEEALTAIAERAKEEGTGARSLRKIMEDVLLELQFSVPGSGSKHVRITDSYVRDSVHVRPEIS